MTEGIPQAKTADAILQEKLADYVTSEQITADEFREAYYLFSGVTDEHSSEKVQATAKLMSEMSDEQVPLNRFVKVITGLEEWEVLPAQFSNYIDSLPIEDKEKRMIKSIPKQGRLGDLTIFVGGKTIATHKITRASQSPSFYLSLHDRIKNSLDGANLSKTADISFSFEEK